MLMRKLFAVGLAALVGCGGGSKTSIQIKGSDTELNLVQALAEEFTKEHPDVSITVRGGGSGTGIAALINGEVDIANSSRLMTQEELEAAKARGVEPVRFVFALDGIAVVVNPKNTLDGISLEDLGRLYRGEIKNWKELGGPDLPVVLYGRQSNSGTFVFFREHVVKGDYSPQMRPMNGNSQIVEAVAQDPGGVGYVGLGYLKSAEGKVKALKVDGKLPGEPGYPILRTLQQYTKGKPTGTVKEFLSFEISPKGQEIVKGMGFLPVLGTPYEDTARAALQ